MLDLTSLLKELGLILDFGSYKHLAPGGAKPLVRPRDVRAHQLPLTSQS